jgi:hypothetical protein
MGLLPTHEEYERAQGSTPETTGSDPGVWLTDRDPGELLGVRRVVVSLQDAESIVVAELSTKEEATALAEEILALVERAAGANRWAEIGDRLVRPEAILSVDVEHAA